MRVSLTGDRRSEAGFANGERICPHFFPILEHESVRFEQCANLYGIPTGNLLHDGNHHAQGIVAQDGALRDRGDVLVLGDSNGQSVEPVQVQHDVNIGAAVTDIDYAIVSQLQFLPQFLEHGDLAVTRGNANDRLNFAGRRIVLELRTVNVILGNDTFKRRLDDFLGRSRNNVESEMISIQAVEQLREQANVLLQPDSFSGFDQVLLAHAAIIRVMQQQIGQFRTLLCKVDLR